MKKLIPAIFLAATAITAQATEISNAFKQMGFTQTNRGTNATVFATYERNMDFQTCNRFIGILAQKLNRAPTNIVETSGMRVVRFGPIDFGSMLLTCNGQQIIANLSKNPG